MNPEDILRRFDKLRIWERTKGSERAPHKPLLVLYALGRWQRGLTEVGFREAEKDLKNLLREFGPPRKSDHPEEPFWRLKNDDVWTVHAPEGLIMKAGHPVPRITELRSHNVKAGFSGDVQTALRNDENLLSELAVRILDEHFTADLHQRVLDAVKLVLDVRLRGRRRTQLGSRRSGV
jgi:putative restriction endonuclease